MVACATDRWELKYLDPTLVKAYFERIRLPSWEPSNLGTKCEYQVMPVRWLKRLTSMDILSGGISQTAARSGLMFAIHVAVRS
jgi:hypothetical protein